jgi:hypothetical protein
VALRSNWVGVVSLAADRRRPRSALSSSSPSWACAVKDRGPRHAGCDHASMGGPPCLDGAGMAKRARSRWMHRLPPPAPPSDSVRGACWSGLPVSSIDRRPAGPRESRGESSVDIAWRNRGTVGAAAVAAHGGTQRFPVLGGQAGEREMSPAEGRGRGTLACRAKLRTVSLRAMHARYSLQQASRFVRAIGVPVRSLNGHLHSRERHQHAPRTESDGSGSDGWCGGAPTPRPSSAPRFPDGTIPFPEGGTRMSARSYGSRPACR